MVNRSNFLLIFSKDIGKRSHVILLACYLLVSGKKKGKKNVLIRGAEHYINTLKVTVFFYFF